VGRLNTSTPHQHFLSVHSPIPLQRLYTICCRRYLINENLWWRQSRKSGPKIVCRSRKAYAQQTVRPRPGMPSTLHSSGSKIIYSSTNDCRSMIQRIVITRRSSCARMPKHHDSLPRGTEGISNYGCRELWSTTTSTWWAFDCVVRASEMYLLVAYYLRSN